MWSTAETLRQRREGDNNTDPVAGLRDHESIGNVIKKDTTTTERKVVKAQNSTNLRSMIKKFLEHYSVFAGKSWNQDKVLKVLQYTLWMLSRFYAKSSIHAKQGLLTLSSEISWARYVTRLLGLPLALQDLSAQYDGASTKSRRLGKLMAWSMVLYYPLEALAYAKWKAPRWIAPSYGQEHRLAERASAWSCRAWLAYIVLDLVQSVRKLQHPAEVVEQDSTDSGENVGLSTQAQMSERLQLVRNVLFVAPAIHWSLPQWDTKPWLSESVCQTLMWIEAIVSMVQATSNMPATPAST